MHIFDEQKIWLFWFSFRKELNTTSCNVVYACKKAAQAEKLIRNLISSLSLKMNITESLPRMEMSREETACLARVEMERLAVLRAFVAKRNRELLIKDLERLNEDIKQLVMTMTMENETKDF